MNSARKEALFALALEKPAEKRAAFLDVMCEGDPVARRARAAGRVTHRTSPKGLHQR